MRSLYLFRHIKLVAYGFLRGVGAMLRFLAATFTDLILRVALAFAFSGLTGKALGIWCAWPVGWTVAMFLSVFFYRREYTQMSNL